MAAGKKYYTVWVGQNPGVYDSWEDAREQVANYPGARFKAYDTPEAATRAYRHAIMEEETAELASIVRTSYEISKETEPKARMTQQRLPAGVDPQGWAVDAACSGNPGTMEYRGVDLATGRQIFRIGPFKKATNNIGEFLAIVHALALQEKLGVRHTIYSDSKTGMAWVRDRKVKTTLTPSKANEQVFELMRRALDWLNTHPVRVPIVKWQTEIWGEIPADFGRK